MPSPTQLGLDYAFSHPNLACAWGEGFRFVARYIGDLDPNPAKYLDAPELAALQAQGFAVAVVRETTAGYMLTDDGGPHARASRAHCNALGMYGIPIYYALDVDPRGLSPSWRANVHSFLAEAAQADGGGGSVGIYGSDDALDWFMGPNCHWGWQTYAWSGGRISDRAHFRQYKNGASVCGGTVDLNVAYAHDFGQWPRPGAGPTPPPTQPSSVSEELLMPWPVIAHPTNEQPWTALLPGKIIRFVDWDPLPPSTGIETWAPGWAYYEGGAEGYFQTVETVADPHKFNQRIAVAQQYTRLPSHAYVTGDVEALLKGSTGDRIGDLWLKLLEIQATGGGDVDEAALAAQVLAVLTPEAIAGAIPEGIADAVADELRDRLTG